MATNLVRSEVTETGFGLYFDEDLKSLSACKITSPLAYDPLGNALPNGLYDPHLGPTENGMTCETCGTGYVNCPGHPGHIELDVPVYHPLLFTPMLNLLKSNCAFCHRLRLSQPLIRQLLVKMKLLEMGESQCAQELDDLLASSSSASSSSSKDKNKTEKEDTRSSDLETKLRIFEDRYAAFSRTRGRTPVPASCRKQLRELMDSFQKLALKTKKCENCGMVSPSYRKDGYAKIFQKSISKKLRLSLSAQNLRIKSGLEAERASASKHHNLSESEDSGSEEDEDGEGHEEEKSADKFLVPLDTEAIIRLLWQHNTEVLDFIWSRATNFGIPNPEPSPDGWKLFFSRVVLVPPNRFRPAAKVGEMTSEHPQNRHLTSILEANETIRAIRSLQQQSGDEEKGEDRKSSLSKLVTSWIKLQNSVNCYMDSAKDPNPLATDAGPSGIRQLLERKEGLFRKHMMGKRVNHCCRSVISPDPYLGVNEIGIPVVFAKTLHYATPVNDWNVKYLRTLVERGAHEYPGANMIETGDGKLIKLDRLSPQERAGKAKLLLASPGTKVYRHLTDGDYLLVNRQPSLHKPSIMAHKARILKHVREKTLRFSYANCNAYNADFDGDEMNCHFVQNEIARAEAMTICNTDNQYIVPTSGNPLRGLIQDHVASAVKLTCMGTFLSKAEFQQLVFIALGGLPGTEIVSPSEKIVLPPPTILKPRPMWTGKQVITALLAHLCRPPLPPLHLDAKARTPATAFGAEWEEHNVIFRHGQLLRGVLDKAAIGNASLGIVHAVYELYGPDLAGLLLSSFGRLFTYYLQDAGHTCGIEDMTLHADVEETRKHLLSQVKVHADRGLFNFVTSENLHSHDVLGSGPVLPLSPAEVEESFRQTSNFLNSDKNAKVKLDGIMQGIINKSASEVIKACLPNGLERSFLKNSFSMMVLTGAKGSAVNQSQISCFLGQQALEGQRVPVMVSGKTLPSFKSYDASARAGGFVRDRFLTGVKPQEYYFHCMAGREGLVDTAVKTSRSGYLQRCLVKHLEELKVHYDMTVRDSGSNVIQFLYGEDGLDPMSTGALNGKPNQMLFLARNNQAWVHRYSLHKNFLSQGLETESAKKQNLLLQNARSLQAEGSVSIKKHSVILARRKLVAGEPWDLSNIQSKWYVAQVVKVREGPTPQDRIMDLRYVEDDVIEKKVPQVLFTRPIKNESAIGSNFKNGFQIELVRVGLPDPLMSHLPLSSAIGACSERIQKSISDYVTQNPDGAITASNTTTTVSPSSFELLVWVKYLRSMACPGEAVGCIAAQSIGEPSTQMTLNTFHLAGHGGANVTLGIPRLREIVMTASRNLKTPTMTVPLAGSRNVTVAKTLAHKLQRLPLSALLNHMGGIEVGERILPNLDREWQRQYRIRLVFEPLERIYSTFSLSLDRILETIKTTFMAKLRAIIRQEQNRAGEKSRLAISDFKSRSKGDGEQSRGSRSEEDEEGGRGEEEQTPSSGKGKRSDIDNLLDDEDEENEDEDMDENEKAPQEEEEYEEDSDSEKEGELLETEDIEAEEDSQSDKEDEEEEEVKDSKSTSKATSSKSLPPTLRTPSKSTARMEEDSDDEVKPALGVTKSLKGDVRLTYNEAQNWVELSLDFPVTSRKLLMVQLAEKAAQASFVRSTKNISNAYAIPLDEKDHSKGYNVSVEGVNFEAMWALPPSLVDHNEMYSNDIYAILLNYGVEAARRAIVGEIQGVFAVYGIDVNHRHLSLIADFMTRNGSYVPMNRQGMNECSSPLLQMSFETTCTFLNKAAQEGGSDSLSSPSARIVMGGVTRVGTGCFEIIQPL